MNSTKSTLVIALCIALLIISSFYLLLTSAGEGTLAISEHDTLIYQQYARNIALGHPYIYSLGDSPSTGCTSHLYPFLLAALHKLGAHGNAFLVFTFILNSFFFLGISASVWLIAKKLYPPVASFMLFLSLLSGHTLSATLHLTDIGFFTFLTLSTLAAILYSRKWLALALVILCGLSRPEGFILSIAFLISGIIGWWLNLKNPNTPRSKQPGYFMLYAAAGATAFGATLLINHHLTGYFQFMSVMNKGYFNEIPFGGAITHSLYDFMALLKGVFLGLPDVAHPARQFFLLPSIGGLLALVGVLLYPRKSRKILLCEYWILLAAGAVLLTIATSKWQGLSHDRYLAWLHPIWMIYVLIGAKELHSRLNSKYFFSILMALLFLFQTLSMVFTMADSYNTAIILQYKKAYASMIKEEIEQDEHIGSACGVGIQFYIPDYKIYNLSGITSPDFFQKGFDTQTLRIIDQLKHQPKLRFKYWLTDDEFTKSSAWVKPFLGEIKLLNTDAQLTGSLQYTLYQADWSTLDGGNNPALLKEEIADLMLVDSMDIGFQPDEISHNYETFIRLKSTCFPLAILTAKLGGNDYSDVGRIIIGSERFQLQNIKPNKPIRVVLRTTNKTRGKSFFGTRTVDFKSLELQDKINLRIFVNQKEIPQKKLTLNPDGFSEVFFDLPADCIKESTPTIQIIGDHISYSYWFYQ